MKRRTIIKLLAAIGGLWPLKAFSSTPELKLVHLDKANLMWLWFEDEHGNKVECDCRDGSGPGPDSHPYAYSRFPREVTTHCYHRRTSDGGYGTKDAIFAGGSTWSEDLVLAMATGANGGRKFKLSDAILIGSQSCERCMNALAHHYGLPWGYPEGSDQWKKCNTQCEMCR